MRDRNLMQIEAFMSHLNLCSAPSYFNGRIRGYLAFDSGKDYYYKWLVVINIAVMYNLIFIIGRSCFWELQNSFPLGWIILDYSCDFLYIIDMFVRAHEVSEAVKEY